MTAEGTPQSQIESLQRALAVATERAEKAEKHISSLMDEIDKADAQIATLTRELEAERDRSGSAAMREALETQLSARGTECQCNACQFTRKALSSTAGAEMLERLRKAEAKPVVGNDLQLALRERITSLEATLVDIGMALGTHDASSPQQILEDVNSLKSRNERVEAALEEARKDITNARHALGPSTADVLRTHDILRVAYERIRRLTPEGKSDA